MKIYKQKASGYTEEVGEGFNGWAFLFGPLWFLFKGMIGFAILSLIGAFFAYAIFNIIGALIFWIIVGSIANKRYEDYLIGKGYSVVHKKQKEEDDEEELKWQCDFCGKKFKTKKGAEEHEKKCKKKSKQKARASHPK